MPSCIVLVYLKLSVFEDVWFETRTYVSELHGLTSRKTLTFLFLISNCASLEAWGRDMTITYRAAAATAVVTLVLVTRLQSSSM